MSSNKQEKQQWSGKWMFIFAAVSSAVGLGNIWRFPFTAFENGGGAFVIPYLFATIAMGIPLMLLEFTYGSKFRGTTPLSFARVGRKYEFVGWMPSLIAGAIIFYYGAILVWAFNYAIFAATKAWGTETASFFQNDFLRNTGHALQLGSVNWPVMIGLVILWVPSYFVLAAGVKKGLEKVNLVILPLMFVFAVLTIIRGVTLTNAAYGLNTFFTPDFGRMTDPLVWLAASGQAMFSLSLCMGIMVTYASYMKKGTEIINTSFLIATMDMMFAFMFTVGIFGILGYMAHAAGTDIHSVAGGAGLVFITLPVALNHMGTWGYIVGVGFFGMLAITGWTSFLSLMESFVAPFVEKFGTTRKKMYLIMSIIGFFASVVYATGAANPILGLVDHTVNNFGLIFVGLAQAAIAAWLVRKLPEFKDHLNGGGTLPYFRVGGAWMFAIKFIVPTVMGVNLVLAFWRIGTGTFPAPWQRAGELRDIAELIVWVGGTAVFVVVGSIILAKMKWATPIDEYTR